MILLTRALTEKTFLLAGLIVLTIFSFQYPFTARLPLGNDTPTHIQIGRYPFSAPPNRNVSEKNAALRTNYQLSSLSFSLTRIFPFSWPKRFMIWMALGHLFSGILLGYLLRKIAGPIISMIGMILWGISAIGVLVFAEIGFMPQLWSMTALLLFLEMLRRESYFGAALMGLVMWFAHPGTFVVAALTIAVTMPQLLVDILFPRSQKKKIYKTLATILLLALAALLLIYYKNWPSYIAYERFPGVFRDLFSLLSSPIGFMLPLSPMGFFIFINNVSLPTYFRIFLASFGVSSFVLGFNSLVGIGILESRFIPFAIISLIIFGSIGFYETLKLAFAFKVLRFSVLTIVLFVASFQAWHSSAYYLKNPGINKSYRHLSSEQEKSYLWMKNNLEHDSVIAHNNVLPDEGIKWMTVITELGNHYSPTLFKDSCEKTLSTISKENNTHAIFFTEYQKIPEYYPEKSQLFKKIHHENKIEIYELPYKIAKDAAFNQKNPSVLCSIK